MNHWREERQRSAFDAPSNECRPGSAHSHWFRKQFAQGSPDFAMAAKRILGNP